MKNKKPPEPDDDFDVVWRSHRPDDRFSGYSRNRKPPTVAGGLFTEKEASRDAQGEEI